MRIIKSTYIRCILGILFIFCFLCCKDSIALEPAPYDSNNMELYTIAAFSIPYADDMGTSITTIESDNYGRVLFQVQFGYSLFYHESSDAKNNWLYAYGICQKSDQERTYYYEDDCFQIYKNKDEFTIKQQNELKELNDWGSPLIMDKMTSRIIIPSGNSKLNSTVLGLNEGLSISMRLDDLFLENGSINKDHVFARYLDCDEEGNSIGVVWGYSKTEKEAPEIEAYFIMVRRNCLVTRKAEIVPINDTLHFWKELKDFKTKVSWGC